MVDAMKARRAADAVVVAAANLLYEYHREPGLTLPPPVQRRMNELQGALEVHDRLVR